MLTKLFSDFFNSERAGGIILLACTLVSVALANSIFSEQYSHFWHSSFGGKTIEFWINDGLMTIFFLLIGLELERELYSGDLSSIKAASLPAMAAVGGMIVPALVYSSVNWSNGDISGIGIPMATDIAFSLGILSLLGKRIPLSLKIFLTALAVIDDLGAIVLIAFFYSTHIDFNSLGVALGIFTGLLLLNRFRVFFLLPYLIGGTLMWYFMYRSGVHATLTGVLLAFTIPYRSGQDNSPSYRLQHFLHKPVAFVIMPLFALANTCVIITSNKLTGLFEPYSLGIIAGLLIGKPVGITLFSIASVKLGLSSLPQDITWKHVAGIGFLAGIGFTMSIFITLLAFEDPDRITVAKIAILGTSIVSGALGYIVLRLTSGKS
jgi:NhaA family Na+:H+ antiporter